jgi:hypothetical protein
MTAILYYTVHNSVTFLHSWHSCIEGNGTASANFVFPLCDLRLSMSLD